MVVALGVAAVQAAVAFAGYLIARVPHPFFFAFVTFFVAMIPAIGAAGVCVFAALILLVTGHAYMAIFLAVWGILVVVVYGPLMLVALLALGAGIARSRG